MNNQDFFNSAVAHLRKQGKRAIIGGICAYETTSGLMCAVGGVMSAELRQKVLEEGHNESGIEHLKKEAPAVAKFFKGVNEGLMGDVQYTHDKYDPKEWDAILEHVAAAHGLKMPESS